MGNFKQSNPEEAAALEVEIAALIEEAIENLDTDPWWEKLYARYPSRQEWEYNPRRSGFIHDLFEASGFCVRDG